MLQDSPIVVLLAEDLPILGEAGELGVEGDVAAGALEAVGVPLFVDSQQVVPVHDLTPAPRAQPGLDHVTGTGLAVAQVVHVLKV